MCWGKWVFEIFLKDLCEEILLDSEVSGIHEVITRNKKILIKRRARDEFHLKGSLFRRSQEKLLHLKSFGMNMQGNTVFLFEQRFSMTNLLKGNISYSVYLLMTKQPLIVFDFSKFPGCLLPSGA